MRILVGNVHFAPDSFGGATIVVEETVRRLRDRGHEVVVFTATQDGSLRKNDLFRYEAFGIPVIAVKVGPKLTVETTYDAPGVTRKFNRVLDSVRPDVVHLHAIQALGVGVAEAALKRNIPTVVSLHDAWWLCERQFMVRDSGEHCGQTAIRTQVCATCVPDAERSRIRHERSLSILNRCAAVLTPSHSWREVIVASGVSPDRVSVNGNGVSRPGPGWQRSASRERPRLGYVGGLGAVKGSPDLIKALRQLGRSDYELVAVDSAANLGHTSMNRQHWPVPGDVTVIPGYTSATRDDFFGTIDALVAPSQARETYGLTVREAVLRGTWVIMPDGDGGTDHILDGRNGTVYSREGGLEALSRALDHYLDNHRELRPDPVTSGRIPTYDDQVDDLLAHYRSVLSNDS